MKGMYAWMYEQQILLGSLKAVLVLEVDFLDSSAGSKATNINWNLQGIHFLMQNIDDEIGTHLLQETNRKDLTAEEKGKETLLTPNTLQMHHKQNLFY